MALEMFRLIWVSRMQDHFRSFETQVPSRASFWFSAEPESKKNRTMTPLLRVQYFPRTEKLSFRATLRILNLASAIHAGRGEAYYALSAHDIDMEQFCFPILFRTDD